MNCFGVLNFNCLRLDLLFGGAPSYEEEALSRLYKEMQVDVEEFQGPALAPLLDGGVTVLSSIEIVRVEEGLGGRLSLVAISIVNIFSLIVFGSRKWAFVLSENSLDSSESIYMNTWSFTDQAKVRFREITNEVRFKGLKGDYFINQVWERVKEDQVSIYISHKKGAVEVSHYFTSKYIFKHIKEDGKLEAGGSKKCKKVEEREKQRAVARLSLLSKDDEEGLKRLRKEIRFLERLKGCPFVVQMLAADEGRINSKGQEKLAVYLDFYNQGNLLNYLNNYPNLDLPVKIEIARDLIQDLKEIHDRGIVHNDIKLENVLLRIQGQLIEPGICDFDLAWDKTNVNEEIAGTAKYCSPEKIYMACHPEVTRSFEEFKRADVWSLGLVLSLLLLDFGPDWLYKEDHENLAILNRLNRAHGSLGSFFEEPKDLHSVEHLIWEMVQYDASKRPTMAQVAKRWAQLYTS
jgi:serine/threonine protein kinase